MADFTYNAVQYTLSITPEYPLSIAWDDQSVIRDKFEAGYTHTRPRFTRIPRDITLRYKYITDADKSTLNNLFKATQFAAIFVWRNPQNNTDYNVRFKATPKAEYVQYGWWNCEITLECLGRVDGIEEIL